MGGMTAQPSSGLPERRRLGDVLIERDLITQAQLDEALAMQQQLPGKERKRLGKLIVEMGFLTERQIAEALAELLALELIEGGDLAVPMEVARLLPRQVAERARVLILGRTTDGLRIATADPTNVVALDDVRAYTGSQSLSLVVATDSMIQEHIARIWSMTEDAGAMSKLTEEAAATDLAEEAMLARVADQAPTVKLVNQILADAVRLGASDIHVEQQHDGIWVRNRIDGVLRDVTRVPKGAAPALVSRLKIVSGMDIAQRRLPQDGRMKIAANGVAIDARVSTLPSVHGEKVVIRLLPDAERITSLHALGMTPDQLGTLLEATTSSQGLVLITGPTGSGKTNTLYSVLAQVATRDKNVVTLEDPVEIQLPGITQVQIHERAGLTFARGLRSVLRQDPDVILVGEVRDGETAGLALEASLTGHLVLSTLHTNSAAAAVTRLVDMGVEPFLVASSLALVVAQRLVRRPCPACATPYEPTAEVLDRLRVTSDILEGARPIRGAGCMECTDTGYRGRLGIFEVLPVDPAVREVLLKTPTEGAVRTAALAGGMVTLREAGLAKACRGETTFEEVLRVS
ncbi:MAG: type pilus assembly protein PilB [Actinomycetota bacterium]|nr:type pilus assembly protein PilB [Actinomycetota bacterium]